MQSVAIECFRFCQLVTGPEPIDNYASSVIATDEPFCGAGFSHLLVSYPLSVAVQRYSSPRMAFQFKLAAIEAKLTQANEFEQQGDQFAAASRRSEAETLLEEAATEYLTLRRTMLPGKERTAALEDVLVRARELTRSHSFDRDLVNHWPSDRSEAHRIVVLALMEGSPQLRSLDSILNAAVNPRSAFEHYHALQLLEWMIRDGDVKLHLVCHESPRLSAGLVP